MEQDPEDTFYNFAAGIWAEMQRKGHACRVSLMARRVVGLTSGALAVPSHRVVSPTAALETPVSLVEVYRKKKPSSR